MARRGSSPTIVPADAAPRGSARPRRGGADSAVRPSCRTTDDGARRRAAGHGLRGAVRRPGHRGLGVRRRASTTSLRDGGDLRRARLLVTRLRPGGRRDRRRAGLLGVADRSAPAPTGRRASPARSPRRSASTAARRVLATPIQAVARRARRPAAQRASRGALARSCSARARPIATPMTVGGLRRGSAPPSSARRARARRTILLAPSASAVAAQAPLAPPVPGSAVAIGYATGDLSAGRDRHRRLRRRRRGLGARPPARRRRAPRRCSCRTPTSTASSTTRSGTDEAATYKLGAPVATIGTLRQDGLSGGRRAGSARCRAGFPLRVTARDLDTGRRHVLLIAAGRRAQPRLPGRLLGARFARRARGGRRRSTTVLGGSPVAPVGRHVHARRASSGRRKPLVLLQPLRRRRRRPRGTLAEGRDGRRRRRR